MVPAATNLPVSFRDFFTSFTTVNPSKILEQSLMVLIVFLERLGADGWFFTDSGAAIRTKLGYFWRYWFSAVVAQLSRRDLFYQLFFAMAYPSFGWYDFGTTIQYNLGCQFCQGLGRNVLAAPRIETGEIKHWFETGVLPVKWVGSWVFCRAVSRWDAKYSSL